MPDYYPLIKAARYLGCKPWELMDQPPAWVSWAIGVEGAESRAEEMASKNKQASQTARQQWEQSNR